MNTTTATATAIDKTESRPRNNGQLTFFHANGKGTGMAARFELKLDPRRTNGGSCFFLEMARQKTAASRGSGGRVHATFDWETKATVKLGFMDLCEFLSVLEGKQEQVGGERNGLYHDAGASNTIIGFKKGTERGYCLGVSRKNREGEIVFRGHIVLSEAEALGLRHVFQAGLFHVAFHESLLPTGS
jgi:hypothetical protein